MLSALASEVVWAIDSARRHREWRRAARRGVYFCGVRVRSGRQRGFATREWRTGLWRIEPKRLRFAGVRAGEPPLSFEAAEFEVLELVRGSRRSATSVEELGFRETTVVWRLRTESAELEWSVPARLAAAAIRALHARA